MEYVFIHVVFDIDIYVYIYFKKYFIDIELIYNVLISAVQQSDSVIPIYIVHSFSYSFPFILFFFFKTGGNKQGYTRNSPVHGLCI